MRVVSTFQENRDTWSVSEKCLQPWLQPCEVDFQSAPNHTEATDGQGRKTHMENFSSEILKIYNIKCSYLSIDVKSSLVAVYFYCHK